MLPVRCVFLGLVFACAVFAHPQTANKQELKDLALVVSTLDKRGDDLRRFEVVMSRRSATTSIEIRQMPPESGAEPSRQKSYLHATVTGSMVKTSADTMPRTLDRSLNRALLVVLPKLDQCWQPSGKSTKVATFEVRRDVTDKDFNVNIWFLPARPEGYSTIRVDKAFKSATIYPSG